MDLALENARRVEDFNELTHHYLSVIGAKLTRTLGALDADAFRPETAPKLTEQMQTACFVLR